MTKRKILISVTMASAKSRSKAMVLAAKTNARYPLSTYDAGVSSIVIAGDDKLEVVGEGIDITCLVRRLSKKLCHAEILKVEEVKDRKKEGEPKHCVCPAPCACAGYHHALMMTPLVCFDEPTAMSSSCHVM